MACYNKKACKRAAGSCPGNFPTTSQTPRAATFQKHMFPVFELQERIASLKEHEMREAKRLRDQARAAKLAARAPSVAALHPTPTAPVTSCCFGLFRKSAAAAPLAPVVQTVAPPEPSESVPSDDDEPQRSPR